jgi:hypothetical protein
MKPVISVLLSIISSLNGEQLELGHYPAHTGDGKPNSEAVEQIVSTASKTIWYGDNQNYHIKLGREPNGSFQIIRPILEGEPNKDFIVVYFNKSVLANGDEFTAKNAEEVTKQMKEVGYKRVVILGASTFGVHYIADTNKKQNKP